MFVMNEETKQKISRALQGNQNGLGCPCSEEKKKKYIAPAATLLEKSKLMAILFFDKHVHT